jgi:hypothetical protein
MYWEIELNGHHSRLIEYVYVLPIQLHHIKTYSFSILHIQGSAQTIQWAGAQTEKRAPPPHSLEITFSFHISKFITYQLPL